MEHTDQKPPRGRRLARAVDQVTGQRPIWGVIALALVVAGMVASFGAAGTVAGDEHERSVAVFDRSVADIVTTTKLAIQREQDLVVSASALAAEDPDVSATRFATWSRQVRAFERYPELSGLGLVKYVPAAGLKAYAAKSLANNDMWLDQNETFAVMPPGERAFYCFPWSGVTRGKIVGGMPPDLDLCAVDPHRILSSRDTGAGTFEPIDIGGVRQIGIQTPIYSSATPPMTSAERRASFVGWLGISVDPSVILDTATSSHPGTAMTLRYEDAGRHVDYGEPAVTGRHTVERPVGDAWTAVVSADVASGRVRDSGQAIVVLLAGCAASILVGVLVLVLATGRDRALRLVGQKTGELRHQALHDALTGLPNRALILDRIERALARARRQTTPIAVLFLDLDGFKAINDTYGHAYGDKLLRAVSERISGVLRDSDTVGRLGGDEFVVLVEGDSLGAGAGPVAERIRAVLAEPFDLNGPDSVAVVTRASIGIAVGVRPTADEMLRDADVALYEAKDAGKDCYVVFENEMHTAVQDRLELEMDLRVAVENGELYLAYQPTFDLRSRGVTGVEALLRWQHPTRGLVMPDAFIKLAEETGLIVPIGRWVLGEACRQAAEWERRGVALGVSVNISGRQFSPDVDLLAHVREALVTSGMQPGLLTLEITESMLMRDATASARRLRALKTVGVRIAIDDFGTGYSSLAYLQQFPVDALKIDRSFISGIAASPDSGALIHTLVQLGKALGLETLAEGIEEDGQLQRLRGEQCDTGQGYLFARPLSPEALEDLLGMRGEVPEQRAAAPVGTSA